MVAAHTPRTALVHAQPQALLGVGEVRHRRLRPRLHSFVYPTWFLLVPMRAWRAGAEWPLARNERAWVSFHDRDHGDGGPDALAWVEALLQGEGVLDADGEIWLHTYPRVGGFAFKPVSFWYAERRDGSLAAVLAEVNNTFGERHGYLLTGEALSRGGEVQARKVFHVSPFCRVNGHYRFTFMRRPALGDQPARTLVRVDHDDEDGPLIETSVSGLLQPLDRAALRRVLWRMPLLTLAVLARIHWQALRLACKQVPWFHKPPPPPSLVSR